LDAEEFQSLKEKLLRKNVKFVNEPYIRFEGEILEQETMFIKDPNDNVMEFKTMTNPDALFGG
jgi:extradiol dioxygenase family protein